jgi:oligopeptidase B
LNTPNPKKKKLLHKEHGNIRVDNYHWLKDRESQEVVDYLKEENDYFLESTKHWRTHEKNLYDEITAKIVKDDNTVPYFFNGYYFYVRYEDGKDYPIYCRKIDSLSSKEEILLDVNLLAEDRDYCVVNNLSVSPDNKYLLYCVDYNGREKYSIYVREIENGIDLDVTFSNSSGSVAWAKDSKTFFYVVLDHALRRYKVLRTNPFTGNESIEVYEEKDERFNIYVNLSKSKEYVFINIVSKEADDLLYIKASSPESEFKRFTEREEGHEYSVAHYKNRFYIITNKDDSPNFKLCVTDEGNTEKENWKEVIKHEEDVLLTDIEVFNDYIVLTKEYEGNSEHIVYDHEIKELTRIKFEEAAYDSSLIDNRDFESKLIRYTFNSPIHTPGVYDYNPSNGERTLLKQTVILDKTFNPKNYIVKRDSVKARDGVEIPITIIGHKDYIDSENKKVLLYGYGSYGQTIKASFSTAKLSLYDRGVIWVTAHVRGSRIKGENWYKEGKFLKKKNTFNDFIDVSNFLIDSGFTKPETMVAWGRSAGGLLMGVTANEAPENFAGILAGVPFVDVVSTMLDESIPLTVGEYDEWGNPNKKEFYDYMLSYSPYDNVVEKSYPSIFASSGLNDPRVQYWEPAKWIAKLRDNQSGESQILHYCEMETGHFGHSGRFGIYESVSRDYCFILDKLGLLESKD